MIAAEKGHIQFIDMLHAEIGMQDADGMTALMLAVLGNQVQCVKLLLEEVGIKNDYGDLAIDLAADNENDEIVNILEPLEGDVV